MIKGVLDAYRNVLDSNDIEFLFNVWSTDPAVYEHRVKRVGFSGLDRVLDAGCGMGQWTHALAKRNSFVYGVDFSLPRTTIAANINYKLGSANTAFSAQSIEKLAFRDGSFDGIYCYSVIYTTDYRAALQEFRRVLKPGGKLYLCGNGTGWYLRNLLVGSSRSRAYDARRGTMVALCNTITYALTGARPRGGETIVRGTMLESELLRLGFKKLSRGDEGTLATNPGAPQHRFFRGRWLGLESVYEVLAIRGNEQC